MSSRQSSTLVTSSSLTVLCSAGQPDSGGLEGYTSRMSISTFAIVVRERTASTPDFRLLPIIAMGDCESDGVHCERGESEIEGESKRERE